MEMVVRIDVIERETGGAIGRELGLDLGADLPTHRAPEEDVDPGPYHVRAQRSGTVHQIRNTLAGQGWCTVDQHQMQSDAQPRHAVRACHGVGGGGRTDHQAGRGQDAVSMRLLDRLVDLGRQPEIVGGDDQRLQCAISRRSRRNWKNSTPSRRRRFIICGLRTISPTIEAILPRAEVEAPVERLDRVEDLGVRQMRIVQRRDLHAVVVDQLGVRFVEPAVLHRLPVQEGAGIGRGQRHLDGVRIDLGRRSGSSPRSSPWSRPAGRG